MTPQLACIEPDTLLPSLSLTEHTKSLVKAINTKQNDFQIALANYQQKFFITPQHPEGWDIFRDSVRLERKHKYFFKAIKGLIKITPVKKYEIQKF